MRWSSVLIVVGALGLTGCGDDAVGSDGTDTSTGGTTDGTSVPPTGSPDTTADETGETAETSDTEDPPQACASADECDDDNPCTEDACVDGVCEADGAVLSNECRPQIDVEFPPRGATLEGESPVITVEGTVTSGAGPITSLVLNGEQVPLDDDGRFSSDITAQVGGNTLVFDAVDAFEVPRRRVQSFLWSTGYHLPTVPTDGIAEEGLAVYLAQETLDDGDRSPPIDDIASLLGLAVENIDIDQYIDPNTPLAGGGGYNAYLTSISYDSTSVALDAIDGGLHLTASLNDISGDLLFACESPICSIAGDGTGGLTIQSVEVNSDLFIDVDVANQIVVVTANTDTTVTGLDLISNNNFTDFLLMIIEPFIVGGIVSDIEAELNAQVDTLLGPALSQAFNGLAPNSVLAFPNLTDAASPIEVELVTDFYATDFHDGVAPPASSPLQGGLITLRGGGYAQAPVIPYRNLGVPDRAGCAEGPPGLQMPREGALEIGLGDDLLNQLLHGAWQGGLLEFDLPEELLPPPGLISDVEIHISGMLAPTASDCSPDGQVRTHLGDVHITGSLLLNDNPITFEAFSSLLAGLEFTPTASGVAITISDVERIDTELTVEQDAGIETEPLLLATLETQLVDGVLGAIASGGLGEINLPQIDVSSSLGLPPGSAVLVITTEEATRAPGVTVIVGHL